MPKTLFRTLLLAAVIVAGAMPLAQQTPQQRPPVFRGESVLVTVDVYPQRDGRIVEGLTAGDFQVLEDGKPQTVENFEFVRVEPSLSESGRRDPNSVREMLELAADPHNRVFVVFLDQLHVTVDGSAATRRPMVDSLNRIIGPNDLFGVMTQNTDPRALTFGRRLISVEEQLSKYWTWGERYRLATDPTDPLEEDLKTCFKYKPPTPADPLPPWYVDDNGQQRYLYELLTDRRREDRTLTSLERLIEQLSGMREARTVTLLVTEGWRLFRADQALGNQAGVYGPTPPQVGNAGGRLTLGGRPNDPSRDNSLEKRCNDELVRLSGLDDDSRFKELIKRANRANVSFYPVNPAGLRVFDTPMSEANRPNLVEDGNRLRVRGDTLRTLAENTDGIAVIDTNDLAGGMRRIVDDVSAYYLLGYYSTNTAHDGRFRRIEVKSKAPGLQLRARRGYVAPANKPAREVFTSAPAGPEPPKGLDTALGELGRLSTSADVFTRGAIVGDRAQIVVEIASSRAGVAPWSGGADVQVVLAPDGGPPLPPVTGRIEPNTRGVLLTVPLGAAATSARVVTKISAGRRGVRRHLRGFARRGRTRWRRRSLSWPSRRHRAAPAGGRFAVPPHRARAHRVGGVRRSRSAHRASARPHRPADRDSRRRDRAGGGRSAGRRGRSEPGAAQRGRLSHRADGGARRDDRAAPDRVPGGAVDRAHMKNEGMKAFDQKPSMSSAYM